ncbi:FGGY-family carbohydrate kinase [Rothia halotolerans]|uniref:FGGY-family carbohydrate kinase n=1 Tax=Rothia halotolerans TaxID=405770 RepID=UPI00101B8FDC|nr:FGGY family carbohydrate kinase [Rothia halotolerans]
MAQKAFLGLDVGTSSTKAVLVRQDGTVIGDRAREHSVDRGPGGLVEMDPAVWWREFRELYASLVTEHDVDVAGIGVSGMGPCAAVTDLDDLPLAPSALYGIDHRARQEAARLTEELGEDRILRERDSVLTSQAAGPKLAWFAARHPESFAAGVRLYMPSSWIVRHLTGEYVLDRHSASQCTPLYDPERQGWDPDMAERVAPGLRLPRLGWSAEVCGETRPRADLPELPGGIPVIHGTIDAWAEQESVGATGADELFLMYGTTLFLIANSSRRVRHPSMWGTTGTRPGTFNLAGGLATSGALTDWFRSISGVRDYAELIDDAARVAPGSEGLLVLPYFAGERTPIQDPDARGVMAGLTLQHGRGHLYRALLEATAFAVRHNIEVMEDAGASIRSLACAGGGVRSALWPQIVSDVTGRPQTVRRNTVGAAYGDAFMVARALGVVDDLDEWNPVDRVIEPEPTPVYDDLYEDYRRLYEATADIQHRLCAVQNGKGPST